MTSFPCPFFFMLILRPFNEGFLLLCIGKGNLSREEGKKAHGELLCIYERKGKTKN